MSALDGLFGPFFGLIASSSFIGGVTNCAAAAADIEEVS